MMAKAKTSRINRNAKNSPDEPKINEPALAREKRVIIRPGEFEFDPIGARRPDLYGGLDA